MMKKFCVLIKSSGNLKNGFTLLELVVAVFAVSIALGGIVSMLLLGVDSYINADNESGAQLLAANRMEYLKALSADSAAAYNNYFENYNTIPDNPAYSRLTTVAVESGDTGLLKIETTVKWRGISREREYRLTGVNYYQ